MDRKCHMIKDTDDDFDGGDDSDDDDDEDIIHPTADSYT